MIAEILIITLVLAAVLGLLDAAAARWGVDSRPGSTDPRQPLHGLNIR